MALEGLSGGAGSPRLVFARAANSPASVSADLFVQIPSYGSESWGPVPWTPHGEVLPKQNNECLVAFDDRGMPWVIAWHV